MQPANALLPREGFAVERLLAPRQAVVAFFARVALPKPQIERVPLDAALGRVLAQDVVADDAYPAAARSAMDGFAIASSSVPGTLTLAGEVRMGEGAAGRVAAGQAMRIPTGGTLPPGADAVVPVEETSFDEGSVTIAQPVAVGENVVPRGADMESGERILGPGVRIGARHIGLFATLGIAEVAVYRRPVVAVMSSGDELVAPGAALRGGQVRDSNRYAIAAALEALGAVPRHFPTLPDEEAAFCDGIASALAQCDAAVLTGGSSVGERDRLPATVAALGDPGVVVHGLRVKPGKPTLLGALGAKPIIGLPGNPASALMMLEAVGAPVLAALTGAPVPSGEVRARLGSELGGRPGWTWYVPVALGDEAGTLVAHPLALRSFSVSLTARAGGYVVVGERDERYEAGVTVTVHRFLGG